MRKLVRGLVVGMGCLLLLSPAFAEEEEEDNNWLPGGLSGNVSFASDYSFRGISQTQRDMALQGGIDWEHDVGVHLGLWASSIQFRGTKTYLEQDFYGGYAGSFGDFSYDVLAIYFFYPMGKDLDYWEFVLNTGYDFGVASVRAGLVGSPDYYGTLGRGLYPNVGATYPIPLDIPYVSFSLDGTFGYTNTKHDWIGGDDNDYLDWSFAVVADLPFNLSLDFRYVGTDITTQEFGNTDAGDRFVFKATYSF